MAGNVFIDTNVLLYYYEPSSSAKFHSAQQWVNQLWAGGRARTSIQVLNEFYVNARRKQIPVDDARAAVRDFSSWDPILISVALIERAWHWCDTAQINFWDALIVAAAEQCRARYLLSEDFQAGRKFAGVTVVNPFEQSPAEFQLGTPLLDQ